MDINEDNNTNTNLSKYNNITEIAIFRKQSR